MSSGPGPRWERAPLFMHQALSILAATTTTVAGNKKSNSSSYGLLLIIAIFAGAYLLFIRPRQKRLRQQKTPARQLSVGDDVVTAGGIHGRLVSLSDDQAEVEVAPGVVLTFLRRAVNLAPGSSSSGGTTGSTGVSSSPSDEPAPGSGETEHKGGAAANGEAGHGSAPGDGGNESGPDEKEHPSGAGDAAT